MPVAIGATTASRLYLGDRDVRRLYLGEVLAWTSPDTPVNPPDVDPNPSGFPTSTNTGCRLPEAELTPFTGTWQSSAPNQLVENTLIRGRVVIRHPGVTFRDCVIEGTFLGDFRGNYPIDLQNQGTAPTGVVFDYVTVRGAPSERVETGVAAVASSDRLEFTAPHGLTVGAAIYLTSATAGGLSNVGYYIKTVPTSTSVTLCRLDKAAATTNITSDGTCSVWRFRVSPELPALYMDDGCHYTMNRCQIRHLRSGVRTGKGGQAGTITIQDTYIAPDLGPSPSDAHRSAVACDGAQRVLVQRCTLLTDQPYSSNAIAVYAQDGPVQDITITGNQLGTTGSFAIYGGCNPGEPYTAQTRSIVITNNVVLAGADDPWRPKGGVYGPTAYSSRAYPGNVFDGNVIDGGPYDGVEFGPNPGSAPWDGTAG